MKPKKNYVPGAMDVCLTPEYGVLPVLPYIKDLKVWECASGKGYLASRMRKNGNIVVETDIDMGVDFLEQDCPEDFDVIVTNPPFGYDLESVFVCQIKGGYLAARSFRQLGFATVSSAKIILVLISIKSKNILNGKNI